MCSIQECETDFIFDLEKCACVCDTESKTCEAPKVLDEALCECECLVGQEWVNVAVGNIVLGCGGSFSGMCCPEGQSVVFDTPNDASTAYCCDGEAVGSPGSGAGCQCPSNRLKLGALGQLWYAYVSTRSSYCCPAGTIATESGSEWTCEPITETVTYTSIPETCARSSWASPSSPSSAIETSAGR